MLRASLCSLAVLGLFVAGLARADDAKKAQQGTEQCEGIVTKVDTQKDTITAKVMKDGKEMRKTFQLSNDVKVVNSHGKAAKLDDLKPGDNICIKEQDGKVTEVKKQAQATITKVDRRAGTVTVQMRDKNGKEVQKTFKLAEDAEYLDSTGRVAAVDVFQSGDDILLIEAEGRLKEMKKANKTHDGKSPGGQ